jgi:hypothetical protein
VWFDGHSLKGGHGRFAHDRLDAGAYNVVIRVIGEEAVLQATRAIGARREAYLCYGWKYFTLTEKGEDKFSLAIRQAAVAAQAEFDRPDVAEAEEVAICRSYQETVDQTRVWREALHLEMICCCCYRHKDRCDCVDTSQGDKLPWSGAVVGETAGDSLKAMFREKSSVVKSRAVSSSVSSQLVTARSGGVRGAPEEERRKGKKKKSSKVPAAVAPSAVRKSVFDSTLIPINSVTDLHVIDECVVRPDDKVVPLIFLTP